jgi:hypothetical protein
MKSRNFNGGYAGLIMLFIGVALMIFFIVRTDLFTGKKGGKTMLEQNTEAVDSAKALKLKLEQNSALPIE